MHLLSGGEEEAEEEEREEDEGSGNGSSIVVDFECSLPIVDPFTISITLAICERVSVRESHFT